MADQLREQLHIRLEGLRQEGVWALRRRLEAEPSVAEDTAPEAAAGPVSSPPRSAGLGTAEPLGKIAVEASSCTACQLSEQRRNVVFGVGNPRARLMFIGEGPGRDEDLQGEPFVGRAGQVLDRIIVAMGLEREHVYIANAVKCRPPRNRNPQPDELAACRHFLLRQVAAIDPEVIVLLGRVAMQAVLEVEAPLGRMRGRFHDWNGVPVMCTYHPAYLLRNPADKRKVWEDIQQVMGLLADSPA